MSDDAEMMSSIFSSNERDSGGNPAPPSTEPVTPAATAIPAPPAAEALPVAPEVDSEEDEPLDTTGRMVPLNELTGSRRKYKARLEAAEREKAAIQAQLDLLKSQQNEVFQNLRPPAAQQPAQQQQPEEEIPDPFTDPEGFHEFHAAKFQRQLRITQLNANEDAARDKHGDEVVDAAIKAAREHGGQPFLSSFQRNRRPYHELVKWHAQHKSMAEIGSDPEAYKKRVREELLAELTKNGGTLPTPAAAAPAAKADNVQQFPGSLSHVTGGQSAAVKMDDATMMSSIFHPDRKKRA